MSTFQWRAKPEHRHVACMSYFTVANSTQERWATQSIGHGGYNKRADTNNLVVLYPQTGICRLQSRRVLGLVGFSDLLPGTRDFARKTGYQISAIRRCSIASPTITCPGGGSSGTFGTPQHFSVADSTSTSVALIWQPDSDAAGFNIYRALSSAGPSRK